MEFRILGPVEVVDDDGVAVDLGGHRERTLLARLLMSVNRAVAAEVLAEELWAGSPPPHCLATLRVYVWRLRRALGPAGGAVITQPPGYRLNATVDQFDAARFERLVAEGRADLAAGRAEAAAARLRRALGIWRGPALADVAGVPFTAPEVTRLDEARLAALEDRVDADLRCGRHAVLAGELDGLAAAHPYRERLAGQRITALYRCGRQADALQAYRDVKARLGEELGIDPGPELRRLEEAILRQDPALEWRQESRRRRPHGQIGDRPAGTLTVLLIGVDRTTSGLSSAEGAQVVKTARQEHLAPIVDARGGRLARTAGAGADWPLAVFESPAAAVAAAADLARSLAGQAQRQGEPTAVRAAVHTGDVELADREYSGSALVKVARLNSIAHGGQVVVSQATAELVGERLPSGIGLRDLGLHYLAGLLRPERVFQLVISGRTASFPPLRSVTSRATGLPQESTSFVGREVELVTIAELLELSRLVTLTGPAGSGKSRLALRAGAQASVHQPGGVWLVQLASITGPDLVIAAVAAAIGVREEPSRPLLDCVAAELRARECLLILDNCEHVLAEAAAVADALLDACPSVRLLATSQSRLGSPDEAAWPVPPLTVPGPADRDLRVIAAADAVRLFCDRAAMRPGFALSAGNAPAIAEICRRLDGIPLALELAAARLSVLAPAQLAARLDDRFMVLTGGASAGLPRHRTLRTALQWSYDLLTEVEQLCFQRLSVFVGGCTLDAVEAVCLGGLLTPEVLVATVSALVDRSLLTTWERCGSMRYGMLESVQHYARERLREASASDQLSCRHADWLTELIGRADLDGPDQAAWLDLIEAEHDNFRTALDWSLTSGEPGPALELAAGLAPFWLVRCYFGEGRRWLDAALQAARPQDDPRLRARALDGAGQLATVQADYPAQRRYQEQSLVIWRALGDRLRVARCLVDLGFMAHIQGDYAAALALHTEGLEIARAAGDQQRTALALSGLGMLALHQDQLDRATACYTESLARFTELGDVRRATVILGNLGVVARNQGDFELARARFEEHLGNARALGDRRLQASALTNLGTVAQDVADLDRSAQLHREALALTEQLGDRRVESVALTNLGLVSQARKDYQSARYFHHRSLLIAEALGEQRSIAEGIEELARVDAAEGHPRRAARLLGASRALREAIGAPIPTPDLPRFERALADVRTALGDDRFSAEWEAGRALPVHAAVALAGARPGTGPVS